MMPPVTTFQEPREPDGFEVGGCKRGEGLEACSRLHANCGEAWRRFVNLDEVLRSLARLCRNIHFRPLFGYCGGGVNEPRTEA